MNMFLQTQVSLLLAFQIAQVYINKVAHKEQIEEFGWQREKPDRMNGHCEILHVRLGHIALCHHLNVVGS